MKILRLKNEEQIRALLLKDNLFEYFRSDDMPALPFFKIPLMNDYFWMIGIDQKQIVGISILHRVNEALMDGHIALYKEFIKKGLGEKFVLELSNWLKEHTKVKSVVGYLPAHRVEMKKLAQKTFNYIGKLEKAQSWDYNLVDVEIYQRIL